MDSGSWSMRACKLLVTVLLPTLVAAQSEPSVNVALQTSFDAGPYLIELLETAALENEASYFPLLDRIAEGVFAESQTDKELYDKFTEIIQQDGYFQSQESLSSFNYALALHAAAPRIEAHYQYYKTSVEPKMMAAQDAACPVWVHLDGQQYCSPALERAQQPLDVDDSELELPFDRIIGDDTSVPSVLYADVTHPLFGQFHETVSRTARHGKSSYRVRYRPSSSSKTQPLFVSGYGAELVLKRTDYIVIDDRDAGTGGADKGNAEDEEKVPDLKPLTTSEVTTLSLNTGSYIMSSSNPLDTLLEVTANFPKYSSLIATHDASVEFLNEYFANRDVLLPPGYNAIWINGLQIENRQINAYSLLDILRRERKIIGQLKDIGLTSTQAIDLLSHDTLAQALSDDDQQRYDWRDDEEGGSVIMWMNDIEEDSRYASWPVSLRTVLQRAYPGQLPQLRRNIHNLIIPIDVGNIKDLDMAVNSLQMMVQRLVPIRIGLVPIQTEKTSINGARLSYYILDTYGIDGLMNFYEQVVVSSQGVSGLESAFKKATQDRRPREGGNALTYTEVLESEDLQSTLVAAKNYLRRLSLQKPIPDLLINGVAYVRDESWFEKASQRLTQDHRQLQIGVYEGSIIDKGKVSDVFLSAAVSSRNTLIIPSDAKETNVVSVADTISEIENLFDVKDLFEKLPRLRGEESILLSEQVHLLVVADMSSDAGKRLLAAALDFHQKHPETEVVLLHNGEWSDDISEASASNILLSSIDRETGAVSAQAVRDILAGESSLSVSSDTTMQSTLRSVMIALNKRLGFRTGQHGLWLNGRIIGPFLEDFTVEDFHSLVEFERKSRIAPVTTAITGLDLEEKFRSPIDLAKVTSIIARSLKSDVPEGMNEAPPPIRINRFKKWGGDHTLIHATNESEPTIQIVAAVDPASEVAQPWISLLKTLSELHGVDVKIYLNPRNKLEELPVKRFYRQVVSSAPKFDENGSLARPVASFSNLPQETLFNLGVAVPPAWLVAPKESFYDLDNIKLSSVPKGSNVEATYELEHILIEGHSRDVGNGQPPRGVQLLLGTENNPHFTDTIIMANLGYFQFKANPGYWNIALKPGRSSQIFNIDSVGAKGYSAQPGDETTSVALMSFQGLTLYPRLSRKPGMEEEDVLEASVAGKARDYLGKGASFASSALASLGLKKSKSGGNADINIFSVASGHLYERLLNVMMLSVMRNTKHSVKFWFIEQFLSPSFKADLPFLSTHYKFEYEMITYKWPHWLRGQKEKQREIWGYKILFLDVLFPLDLDKVIFVDADQVVRTDMMELNNVDLQGAPYGFTPMCDSRTEMEGYRFWKQGYWKNFLAGRPYHISALYVVDLKRFRQLAAGDRLRQQYHALSADPASLSNLDQDLPNHMQHVLPIHSLSQEWLWCATWCSKETLSAAKTIDMCNDPQEKMHKLSRARQVAEWPGYDEEIAQVLKEAKGRNPTNQSQQTMDGTVDDRRKKDEL